jgi:RNA polymerase sigma factor (sigma-70 family)
MGSRDPEAAAQEAIRRSLANDLSRPAIEYYFSDAPAGHAVPEWTLAQLLAWLHGVLRFVVWEDGARVGSRREISAPTETFLDVPDRDPSQLDTIIDAELRSVVHECAMQLPGDRRSALLLRLQGAKYEEIARRLGTNEKTVATWLHRSTRELVAQVRARLNEPARATTSSSRRIATVSHA